MSNLLKLRPWSEFDVLDIPTLKSRIAAGADLNVTMDHLKEMLSPLGVAAYYGNVEACRLILEAGAKPELGKQGMVSPIVMAIEGRYSTVKATKMRRFSDEVMVELIDSLVKHGAKLDAKRFKTLPNDVKCVDREDSPLYSAIHWWDNTAAIRLIDLGANVELPMTTFMHPTKPLTALQYASENGRHKAVEHLIKSGANESCLLGTEDGETPFQVCVRRGHVGAVEYYVRERGEDLGQKVGTRSLLQWAKTPEMKALINSLKAELAVRNALSADGENQAVVIRPKLSQAKL